jgi:hypothetical protein
VKLIEVLPDGTTYNIEENIQRVRYREGYTKPPVWMEKGKVYKVTFQPMQTSNYFAPGHQLRIEISSSNFPQFDRNLNTGGDNYNESQGVVAHNEVHHSTQYPSSITLTVVKRRREQCRRCPPRREHNRPNLGRPLIRSRSCALSKSSPMQMSPPKPVPAPEIDVAMK